MKRQVLKDLNEEYIIGYKYGREKRSKLRLEDA